MPAFDQASELQLRYLLLRPLHRGNAPNEPLLLGFGSDHLYPAPNGWALQAKLQLHRRPTFHLPIQVAGDLAVVVHAAAENQWKAARLVGLIEVISFHLPRPCHSRIE